MKDSSKLKEACGKVHKMFLKANSGVVKDNFCVFNFEVVSVSGSSVFPTTGYANPTLTIISLAIRLASNLNSGAHK